MKKILTIWMPLLIVLVAIVVGYLQYRAAPAGHLLYTPAPDTCPEYAHGFTLAYLAVLAGGALLWLLLCGLRGWMGRRRSGQPTAARRLRAMLPGVCLFVLAVIVHPLFEHALPLQDTRACLQQAG